jgi:deoxyadenosine/deoxycytidine kinase
MLICIEGCLGIGKTTLVQRYAEQVPSIPLYEEVANNPFLLDFYRDQERYALHVQYTFLLLQDRLFRSAIEQAGKGGNNAPARRSKQRSLPIGTESPTVICDFHPVKSLIFSSVVLPPEARPPFNELYRLLHIPQPDLMVYLRADEHTILARLRKRNDVYRSDIDFTYVTRVCTAYDQFFRTYQGPYVTVDTTHIDYVSRPQEISVLLQQIPLLFPSKPTQ